MRDYSIRIPATKERIKILKTLRTERKILPIIKDQLFKPLGKSLAEFNPREVCIRLREYSVADLPSSLFSIRTIRKPVGYIDESQIIAQGETAELMEKARQSGYEKWGELVTTSESYLLQSGVLVLKQMINPLGNFLKIEAPDEEKLKETLALLEVKEGEKIEKNCAELLAEDLGLIES